MLNNTLNFLFGHVKEATAAKRDFIRSKSSFVHLEIGACLRKVISNSLWIKREQVLQHLFSGVYLQYVPE